MEVATMLAAREALTHFLAELFRHIAPARGLQHKGPFKWHKSVALKLAAQSFCTGG